MKLSKTSWHYWLFNLSYEKEIPTNLCPYFWLLVWAVICAPFNFIWNLPITIIDKAVRIFDKDGWIDWDGEKYFGGLFKFSTAINLILCFLVGMVGIWITPSNGFMLVFGSVGYLILAILLIVFVVQTAKKLNKSKSKMYKLEEGKPNIITEFIKAKYNRYCPKIEWTSKEKKPTHEKPTNTLAS